MDWDVLIPILMFAFPVAVAVLDKRAKKRRAEQQSRTVFPPAASGSEARSWSSFPPAASGSGARPAKRPAAQDPSQPFGWAPPSYGAEGGTVSSGRLPQPTDLPRAERLNRSPKENVSGGEHPDRQRAEETVEGQRAISRERHKEVAPETKDPEPKLRIDKKNLILYSEILKPKFDA